MDGIKRVHNMNGIDGLTDNRHQKLRDIIDHKTIHAALHRAKKGDGQGPASPLPG